jgi:predicted esterase
MPRLLPARLLPLLLPVLVLGCAPGEKDDDDDDDVTTDDSGDVEESRPGPDYSNGTCPALVNGDNEFSTGDTEYDVEIILPDNPEGATVLFAWHWLGGTASQAIRYMELEEITEGDNVIVVVPDSDGSQFEWHIINDPDDNPDLVLFDDLLSCLWQQYDVDLDRVHSFGMSAGGLWTTYLTMYRSEWLASTAPLSGGTLTGSYDTPADPIPVLVTWGGESDSSSGLSFNDASIFFSEQLREDGHFVAECEHDAGHQLPPGGVEYAYKFLMDHPKGVDPEPYANGLPSDFPSFCRLP